MPQLDQVTFLSQFFWLCVFFFGFYFVICKHFLPKMGRTLKFRKRKMNLSAEGVQSMQQENEKVRASSKTVIETGLNAGGSFLLSHLQRIESWLNNRVVETNKKQLSSTNTLYVEWIGDNSIRQQLALQGATPFLSPRILLAILAEKCKNKQLLVPTATQRNAEGKGGASRKQNVGVSSRPDSLDQPLTEKIKRESHSAAAGLTGGKSRTGKK